MKQLLSCAVAIVFGVAMTGTALADITDNSGGAISPPDNTPGGASSSIVIGANEIISDVDVTLFGATHTWVGDLVVTVDNGSTTANLIFRVGQQAGIGAGDSSDLGGNYTFSDGGADFWAAAAAVGGGVAVAPGTYAASGQDTTNDATPNPAPVSLAALFGGGSTAGTWTLTIQDLAAGDLGGVTGWGISFQSSVIPEPGSFCLLGLAGLGLVAGRRRR